MELKVKFLKWSAGIPVAMLNQKTAKKLGVHVQDKISIKTLSKYPKELSTIIDTVTGLIKEDEIAVSSELHKRLELRVGQKVDVAIALNSKSLFFIKKKLDNKKLSKEEIKEIIKDIVNNSLSEAEIALFVSGMYKNGMNLKEIIYLIEAILSSGNKLAFRSKIVGDKHSIGGIAGNRTTPIVVSICASAGIIMPKSSSRAITTPAGTADVIETISPVEFTMKELKKIVKKTKACLIWGGALGIVPADSKIIQVEKVLGIDPEAQLLASIMSKKLAMGSKYILIDIPYGKTAKVDKTKALKLKRKFEQLGKHFKVKLKVVLTIADEPMGSGVGPALELIDVIKILNPHEKGPEDLENKSLFLAGELLEMTKKAEKGKGIEMAKKILVSGKAFEKFKQIIEAQGGSLKEIKPAKFRKNILAKKSGRIFEIDNKKINNLARVAGCPADKFAGLYIYHNLKEKVKKREVILTIYYESKSRLNQALKFYKDKKPIIIR
jgi:putative thymidine phosphorylase